MVKIWQVDAFTNRPFTGNPAAVCWLESEADPKWMQSVAAEMNLAETAFVRPLGEDYELRWFTPTLEVDLCGHATLATSHVLWEAGFAPVDRVLRYSTRSGIVGCSRQGDWLELNFPATPPIPVDAPEGLLESLGVEPEYVGRSRFDCIVVLDSEAAVRSVRPDYRRLIEVPTRGVIVTAPSADPQFDFASRFFCPTQGIDEDPVCGSAHCCLTPYWSVRLGKPELNAHQVSSREGILRVRNEGDRIAICGQAVTVLRGELV